VNDGHERAGNRRKVVLHFHAWLGYLRLVEGYRNHQKKNSGVIVQCTQI